MQFFAFFFRAGEIHSYVFFQNFIKTTSWVVEIFENYRRGVWRTLKVPTGKLIPPIMDSSKWLKGWLMVTQAIYTTETCKMYCYWR